jgi:hypothetical protein
VVSHYLAMYVCSNTGPNRPPAQRLTPNCRNPRRSLLHRHPRCVKTCERPVIYAGRARIVRPSAGKKHRASR